MLELDVRAALDNLMPAQASKSAEQLVTGDPRCSWHGRPSLAGVTRGAQRGEACRATEVESGSGGSFVDVAQTSEDRTPAWFGQRPRGRSSFLNGTPANGDVSAHRAIAVLQRCWTGVPL